MIVRLWAGSEGLDPAALRPGEDLLVALSPRHGLAVPDGALLDDHLEPHDRAALEGEAGRLFDEWRSSLADALVVDGLDLAHVWQVELTAQVFMPAARLLRALPHARPARLELRGFSAEAADGVAATARRLGVEAAAAAGDAGAPPPIPRNDPRGLGPATAAALRRAGVPPRVRGNTVTLPYWHVWPVYERMLARRGAVRPLPMGIVMPGIRPSLAVRAAARNGWTGFPSAAAQARARADLAARAAQWRSPGGLHAHAAAVLERSAPASLAEWRHLRRAFARRGPRLVVLPWDSPDIARVLLCAAEDAGATSLVVQHGFDSLLGDPDKRSSKHAAVWTKRDAERLAGVAATIPHVTGNPGAARYAVARPRARASGPPVVLVEYIGRLSGLIPMRIGLRHVRTALEGLRLAGHRSAVVRPHPSDAVVDAYAELGADTGVDVTVDPVTPIDDLLLGASLCVGSLSTATLQAAALGVPAVFLDTAGAPRPWPFDGSVDALPRAVSASELAERAGDVAASTGVLGQAAAIEALGARADATERVAALAAGLVGG